VIEVDEAYKKLAEYLLGNVFIAENDEALNNSNGSVVLERNGKYVKGNTALPVAALVCLKVKGLAVPRTWKKCGKRLQHRKKLLQK
jgi:chromosome segregation protein